MPNRFYTFMVIPEGSSKVKKWIVSPKVIPLAIALGVFLGVFIITTTILSLRFLAKYGEFKTSQVKVHFLEGKIDQLENKITQSDSTLVRVQSFEQRLRQMAQIDQVPPNALGIGPLSEKEEEVFQNTQSTKLSMVDEVYASKIRSMELKLDGLNRKAQLQEQSLQHLYELLSDQKSILTSTPSISPASGWISSTFGHRISPFTGERKQHMGIDIATPEGTKVMAPADGVVFKVEFDPGYGKVVMLKHGYGLTSVFAHNSHILVSVGQKVTRGQPIALSGNTGRSTAPHVHYEVRVNGIPVNPDRYILDR